MLTLVINTIIIDKNGEYFRQICQNLSTNVVNIFEHVCQYSSTKFSINSTSFCNYCKYLKCLRLIMSILVDTIIIDKDYQHFRQICRIFQQILTTLSTNLSIFSTTYQYFEKFVYILYTKSQYWKLCIYLILQLYIEKVGCNCRSSSSSQKYVTKYQESELKNSKSRKNENEGLDMKEASIFFQIGNLA